MKTFSTAFRRESRRRVPCVLCGELRVRGKWDLGSFTFVRCAKCGLLRQDPQPIPEDIHKRYDSSYLDYEVGNEANYRDLELMALSDLGFETLEAEFFQEKSMPEFLDVGCATGGLLAAMRDRGWMPKGVEICRETAEYGRTVHSLDIISDTLEGSNLPQASFDIIHASHLLEHLNDPSSFLRCCESILSDSGYLILTTPNAEGFQAKFMGRQWRSAIYDHLWLFSKKTLCLLLELHGFEVVRARTWGGWAKGLKPAFIKPALDRIVKTTGSGDVMIVLARKSRRGSEGGESR